MAYNKVELDGSTIIDLSTDTAVASDVLSGKTFHKNTGEVATGNIGNLTSSNITFNGNQVSVAKGKYTNAIVTKTIPAGTEGTPTVTVAPSTRSNPYVPGYVSTSASVSNTAGYISGGSHGSEGPTIFVTDLIPENMDDPDPTAVISGKEYINGDGLVRVGTMVNHLNDVNVDEVTSDAQSSSGKIYFEIPENGYYSKNNGLVAPISDVKDAYNTANSSVIAAGNIKSGVNIMGVTGTYSPAEVNLQNKTLAASALNLSSGTQTVNPDSGYDGMTSLVITKPTTLVSGNIKSGVTIAGVTGSYTGLVPSGTITLTDLNATDVTNYASARVDSTNITSSNIKSGVTILGVSGSSTVVDTALSSGAVTANKMASGYSAYVNGTKVNGSLVAQAAKIVTPTTATQTVVSSGKYTTGHVKVAAIQTETKTAITNGTITPTSGKYLTSVTVAIPEWDGTVV